LSKEQYDYTIFLERVIANLLKRSKTLIILDTNLNWTVLGFD